MPDEPEGLYAALLNVQRDAPKLPKDKEAKVFSPKGSYTYRYTSLDTIQEAIGPLLAEHGLVWTARPSIHAETGAPTLKYTLTHAATGDNIEGEMPLMLTEKQQDAQGQGSGITYARRYALCAVLNLVADDDDDGGSPPGGQAQKPEAKADTPKNKGGASEKQVNFLKGLARKQGLTLREIRALLLGAGVEVADSPDAEQLKKNVGDALERMNGRQASKVIEELKDVPVPEGQTEAKDAE